MTTDGIGFYLSHREQITQWAKLEGRVDALMRDAVNEGNADAAINLLKGTSGDQEADFYVRNQALIREWDGLQVMAGQALHNELLTVARDREFEVKEDRNGYTRVVYTSPKLDDLRERHAIWVELFWTRQNLLNTNSQTQEPRLGLLPYAPRWTSIDRQTIAHATRETASILGMRRSSTRDWYHLYWRELEPLSGVDIRGYAERCATELEEAAESLYPVLSQTISTMPPVSEAN